MPIINKGTSFSNGEQLTALKINNLIDQATFNQSATDSVTTDVNSSGQITVNAGGISAAQLATNAVETANILNANVTLPKIAAQADQTVIANVSGGVASPTAVSIVGASGILIDDDALGTIDTKGATQGNIKAYVDSKGITQTALASTTTEVSTTSLIPDDNSAPLITEGTSTGLSVSMTPTSTSTTIRATINARLFHSNAAQRVVMTLFEDNTCVGVMQFVNPSSGVGSSSPSFYFNSASASAHTYSVRFGPANSGTVTLDLADSYGGLNKATIFLEELA